MGQTKISTLFLPTETWFDLWKIHHQPVSVIFTPRYDDVFNILGLREVFRIFRPKFGSEEIITAHIFLFTSNSTIFFRIYLFDKEIDSKISFNFIIFLGSSILLVSPTILRKYVGADSFLSVSVFPPRSRSVY